MYFGSDIKKKTFFQETREIDKKQSFVLCPSQEVYAFNLSGGSLKQVLYGCIVQGNPFLISSCVFSCLCFLIFFSFVFFFLSSTSCPLSLYTLISSFYFLFPAFSGREMLKVKG